MRLNSPRAFATLAFQAIIRLKLVAFPAKIGKPLLRCIGVPVLFIIAKFIQRPGAKDANDGAENIGLLIVNLHQITQLPLHIINGTANG